MNAQWTSAFGRPAEKLAFGAVTDRTLAALRLLLSISALAIIVIDPNEPSRLVDLTHYALVAYILYSLGIYLLARRYINFPWRAMLYVTWVDVLWYSTLITLNSGTNAVFFFFYLFAIIAGSSRGGTRLGLTLTFACTGLFLVLNALLFPQLELDIPRFARRTVYMAVLGYILAYWGGAEAVLRRKLTFLKELSLTANPRFGVHRTIRHMLRRVLFFYEADYCIFLHGNSDFDLTFYRVTKDSTDADVEPMRIRDRTQLPLMSGSPPETAVYSERLSFRRNYPSYRAVDASTQSAVSLPAGQAKDTAEMLNVRSFIVAPLRYRERILGRILVGSVEPNRFDIEDAIFLQQAGDQVLPLIENIRLVDRLASDAAEEERRRIARSVHDRVIQPYLGLQIGLKALQQELFGEEPEPAARPTRGATLLERLVTMTREGIEELRQYVIGLKAPHADEMRLVDSIRRYADKFESATGIHVEVVDGSCGLTMNDRLSAEVFQMTAEALSNIHRHTHSRNAEVRLTVFDNNLELSVENDASEQTPVSFRPVSILERAEALGARAEVLWPEGKTQVRVEVPL